MIHTGDCVEVMAAMEPASVDAIVTDPPYGLMFMGKSWDSFGGPLGVGHGMNRKGGRDPGGAMKAGDSYDRSLTGNRGYQEWCEQWAREALRITKPGGYLLSSGGTRTYHRLASGIEDAGWIIRDCLVWAYASGFPKSRALLKPAWEPIVMARKPGPLRELAIDACRIGEGGPTYIQPRPTTDREGASWSKGEHVPFHYGENGGRWPANLILTDPIFDGDTPGVVGGGWQESTAAVGAWKPRGAFPIDNPDPIVYGDSGTYSRFYELPTTIGACYFCGVPNADASSSVLQSTHDTLGPSAPESASSPRSSFLNGPVPSAPGLFDGPGGSTAPQSAEPLGDVASAPRLSSVRITSGTDWTSLSDDAANMPSTRRNRQRGTSPARELPSSPAKSSDARGPETGITTTTGDRWTCDICAALITSSTIEPSPIRFLVIPKADRAEREPVLGGLPLGVVPTAVIAPPDRAVAGQTIGGKQASSPRQNVHPTVKPLDLMRHLVRLVTPTGGTVLDPFLGSGTTVLAAEMEGFAWVGIEKEPEYVAIAEARLNGTQRGLGLAV